MMTDAPTNTPRDPRTPVGTSPAASAPPATDAAAEFASEQSRGQHTDEARGLYRLLVESVRDYAIFALDPTGHVLSWNAGAERFKGYTAAEIIGQHFSVFYPEEDKWKPPAELEIATATGRFEEEGWRLRKDGTRFWANVVITALRGQQRRSRRLRQGHPRPHRAAGPPSSSGSTTRAASRPPRRPTAQRPGSSPR